ncbi:L-fucose mutarotase [Persicobacter psychrovividus]|uniref:L-fucose mutarotase n=1 Tax=Persicobacter psychrovividus TaxID=387638 RepID=A0ABM7VLS1_9BACT|nr:L-fucose mutarotase [Persicobacter psychrovividus]
MLKGISPLLSPELLSVLCEMGHGDEILLADAHFPSLNYKTKVLRADGINIDDLMLGILPLFELDQYAEFPLVMMDAVAGDTLDPLVEFRYRKSMETVTSEDFKIQKMERFDFYKRVEGVAAIVITGELAKYGNIILKKGVTPVFTLKAESYE